LKEVFNLSIEGVLWKIHYDTVSDCFLIENRIESPRATHFYLVSISGAIINSWEPDIENWWFNTLLFHDKKVYFTLYADEDSPETTELLVYDANKGELIQHYKDCTIAKILAEAIEIKTLEEEIIINLPKAKQPSLSTPVQYIAETEYFKTVAKFIIQSQDIVPVQLIEYLEYSNYIIISYYIKNNEGLDNYLLILDSEGKLLYQDCVATKLKGVGDHTFFAQKEKIYFIKDSNTFKSISL